VHELEVVPFEGVDKIVCCGMGASIYGALVVKSLLGRNAPLPMEIISDYHLPSYVNNNSLVILTSYSGSTEEVLSCANDAITLGAKISVITSGGKLAEFAKANNLPAYIFDPKLNPANIPRLGNGYTILGLLGLLSKLRIIDIEEKEISDALTRLEEKNNELKDTAKKDLSFFAGKLPVIFASEHLAGNAHIMRNQFNETSKTFACYFLVPDLNHHLMEGLAFPKSAELSFLLLYSENYSPKNCTRMKLTDEVVKKNNHPTHFFTTSGTTIYDDFLETLVYGSYLTLYLALYYDQNPAVNPFVDYFKEKLAESNFT
jgi:glucose/mannose-6-phosphate isomerase